MSKPSFQARTAVEFGEEHQTLGLGTTRVQRTANFTQIPIYDAFNPFQTNIEMQPLDRAKGSLDPDGYGTGQASHGITGQVYLFGSGIANLPPDYFRILKACGFVETRISTKLLPETGTPVVAYSGGDGFVTAGDHYYKFTTLLTVTGTDEATTLSEAAFESRPSTTFTGTANVDGNDTGFISVLPSSGIKLIYRTYGGKTPADPFFYVGQVADGETTYSDTLADKNLGKGCIFTSLPVSGALAGAKGIDGTLLAGVYKYKYTSLFDDLGAAVTDSANAVWESSSCTEVSIEVLIEGGEFAIDLTGLPSAGVKRLYRTIAGGSIFYFVQEVASGVTTVTNEDVTDIVLITHELLHEAVDCAIYTPTSSYDKMHSLTINTYLDGRKKTAAGCRGNFPVTGDAGKNIPVRFDLSGIYVTGSKTANIASVAAPDAPSQLCAASCEIVRKSGGTVATAFVPKVRSFGFDPGRKPAPRPDANASCDNVGLLEFMSGTEPDPHFTLTIEDDEDQDFDTYAKTPDTFSVTITAGSADRKKVTISNDLAWGQNQYVAQLAGAPSAPNAEADGIRLQGLDFKLCGVQDSFCRLVHH